MTPGIVFLLAVMMGLFGFITGISFKDSEGEMYGVASIIGFVVLFFVFVVNLVV